MENPIIVNKDLCTGCKACIDVCPRDCFHLDENKKTHFESTICHSCGHCISICPESALSHAHFSSEEYIPIIEKLKAETLNTDQIYFLLKSIRSTKRYKTTKLEKEILEKLVDISRLAPTGHHAQNVEMVIISSPETLQEVKDEVAVAFRGFLKKINNPLIRFFAKLTGKGETIKRAQHSRARFVRIIEGFQIGKDHLFHDAPVVAVFHAKKKSTVPLENCTIASTYMRIVAETYGLGSCYNGYLVYASKYNPKILNILNIPKGNEIYQVLTIGYPKHRFRTFVARNKAQVQWK